MSKIIALALISALLSMAVVGALETKTAEAMKSNSELNKRHSKYSYWLINKVCGVDICEGTSYLAWNGKYRQTKSPYDKYDSGALLQLSRK